VSIFLIIDALNKGRSFTHKGIQYECGKNSSKSWVTVGAITVFFDWAEASNEYRNGGIVLIENYGYEGGEIRKAELTFY